MKKLQIDVSIKLRAAEHLHKRMNQEKCKIFGTLYD